MIPKRGQGTADYDMVIASQPYRLRAPLEFKAQKVVAPLVRALGKGGRLLGIHSHGHDPGLEIIQKVWPGENPYTQSRHDILRATKAELGKESRRYNFNAYADARAIFRYEMHTLPCEISDSIGTSTLFAAWNAAIYVAQMDDVRLAEVLRRHPLPGRHREVLQKHGSLWFLDDPIVDLPQARSEQSATPATPAHVSDPRCSSAARSSSRRASCTARPTSPLCCRRLVHLLPSLPGLPLARTLEVVAAVRAAGLDPVPHVSARRIAAAADFRASSRRR